MSVTAPVLRELMAAGLKGEALVAAVERIDAAHAKADKRRERNARYYAAQRLKASEKRLRNEEPKASESVLKRLNSDASRVRDNNLPLVLSGKNHSEANASSCLPRARNVATRRCPTDFEPDETVWRVAGENGLCRDDAERQLAAMRDHQFRDAHKDWQAVARNWLRRAEPRRRGGGGQQHLSFAVQDAMLREAEDREVKRLLEERWNGRSDSQGDHERDRGVVVALPPPKTLSG